MAQSDESIMPIAMAQVFTNDKRTVSLERASKSDSNITGSESIVYSDAEDIEIVFHVIDVAHEWAREGRYQNVDAVIFDKADNNSLSQDDKITADSDVYIVQDVNPWGSRGVGLYEEITAKKL